MAAEEEPDGGVPGLDLHQHTVAGSAGPEFDYGLLAVRSSVVETAPWVALVVVGESEDGDLVVAIPGKAWNRAQAKRLVPTSCFQLPKATSVRVVAPEDRENPLAELTVRVWLGRLSHDWTRYIEVIEVGAADLELNHTFGEALEGEFADCIPFAPDLVAAAGDRIAYQTAEEEPGGEQAAAPVREDAESGWTSRVEHLERSMGEVQQGIREILGKIGQPSQQPPRQPAPRPSALRGPPRPRPLRAPIPWTRRRRKTRTRTRRCCPLLATRWLRPLRS